MKKDNKKLIIYTIALLVLSAFSVALFGIHVLYLLIAAVGSAFIIEFVFAKGRKQAINMLDWLTTPILFVLFLPATAPIWMVISGTIFAVLFGKALFGGEGKYIFNPALVGILFVTISFPQEMNNMWLLPGAAFESASSASSAFILKSGGTLNFMELLMGQTAGSIGEVFRLLIIFLGIILIVTKTIDWKIPFYFIGSFFFLTAFAGFAGIAKAADPINSVFVGTLLLGAFFVAGDEPTIAKYPKGRVLYALGLGLITFAIRTFSAFPEGVVFAIILMNSIAPLIDKWEEPKELLEQSEELV